ncbi:MAG: hypothetical protein J0L83_14740 [Chitinophagales bacterium]|nr:hypothetical protein [Chitinophagales bacterium]
MTQKQKVRMHCMEYLQALNLTHIFNETEFERIYRNGGYLANAFTFGLTLADFFIRNTKPFFYESGNEAEA